MTQGIETRDISTIEVIKETRIKASIGIVFESVIAEMGSEGQMPDGSPFPMVLEPWPGGRWYRDLGDNAGHWWGTVQVIKPPTLIEICGPMFMSYPAASHVQYRLAEQDGGTLLSIKHHAFGVIPLEHREGVSVGWEHALVRIREIAESRLK